MADESYDYIKRYFGNWGPVYDILQAPISSVHEQVVRFTDAPKQASVLDVATGTGRQAFAFAKQGYRVVGVDLIESMLRVAREKNTYAQVSFELADATLLPFLPRTFGVTCVSFALHDMAANVREKVLREMVRVTVKDGLIVTVDYTRPSSKFSRWYLRRIGPLYESKYYREFLAVDFSALLRSSGMKIIASQKVLGGIGEIIKATPMG